VPPELAAVIRATQDLGLLDRWVDLIFQVNSLDEFRRAVQP
jgi:hypothetical protein